MQRRQGQWEMREHCSPQEWSSALHPLHCPDGEERPWPPAAHARLARYPLSRLAAWGGDCSDHGVDIGQGEIV